VSHADPRHYEPSNVTFGIMPPLERAPRGKIERKLAISQRALGELARWITDRGLVKDPLQEVTCSDACPKR
jgi:methylenetetrahydrofolate--tRNA-(uracil-5-)-methyltransferase